MLTSVLVGTVSIITIVILFSKRIRKTDSELPLPPGPRGLPIVGHLPFLGNNPSNTLMKWKQTFGPIILTNFGSYKCVILNDVKLIKEAFNLDALSGRALFTPLVEMTQSKGVGFTDGPRQVEQRKFVMKSFKELNVGQSSLEFRLQEEILKFISTLKIKYTTNRSKKPIKIKHFFRIPVINSLWSTIMGQRFEENDPMLEHLLGILEAFADILSSMLGQVVWFYPWPSKLLHYFGCNPVINKMRELYEYMGNQIEFKRLDYVTGEPKHFTHAYFDQVAQTTDPDSSFYEQRKEQAVTTGDIFFGAVESTTITLDWFLLYIAREPKIQRKLQSEIDVVLGTSKTRTPSLTDRAKMPYTEAFIQELLRISTVVAMGIFHRAIEDADFHGYRIPKNTIVVANLYGVHHDPEFWPEPNTFTPERFLDAEGKFNKIANAPITFSFGKRSCIGEGYARDQIFLIITNFLKEFTVSCAKNVPSLETNFSFLYSPRTFEIVLQER